VLELQRVIRRDPARPHRSRHLLEPGREIDPLRPAARGCAPGVRSRGRSPHHGTIARVRRASSAHRGRRTSSRAARIGRPGPSRQA
jgi:hypothetical protein